MLYAYVAIREKYTYTTGAGFYELKDIAIGQQILVCSSTHDYERYQKTIDIKPGKNRYDISLVKKPGL